MPGVRGEGVKKKRWTIKVALCLLAGAAVTWGVAWGCALWGPGLWPNVEAWYSPAPPVLPPRDAQRLKLVNTAHSWARTRFWWQCETSGDVAIAVQHDFGLPTRCLRNEGYRSTGAWVQTAGMPSPQWARRGNWNDVLPTRILPLGFALNTLFYAAVVLGMVECVAFARRRVRRGRGRCPSCGYDRAGLAVGAACPECGGRA